MAATLLLCHFQFYTDRCPNGCLSVASLSLNLIAIGVYSYIVFTASPAIFDMAFGLPSKAGLP
jgi:uncharacterized membrane protein YiaA